MTIDAKNNAATRIAISLLLALASGCSIKSMAVNALGNALAEGGGTYARDDDPELVRDASAFGLKTMESLLDVEPEHPGLLLASCRGFVQYAFAYVDAEADYIEADDFERAEHLKKRALRLYIRGVAYGLRGLSVAVPDFQKRMRKDMAGTLAELEKEHAPLLYWTAAGWAAVVGLDKNHELAADLDHVDALMKRAHELDPDLGAGSLHDFFLSWDASRPPGMGGTLKTADGHLERSLAASKGKRVAPLVSYAELVCVKKQDRACFDEKLKRALAFDVDSAPEFRLANLIAQRRARWLLGQTADLFL